MTQSIPLGEDGWLDLGPIGEIPLGQGRCYRVGRYAVAIFRLRDGALRALDADCPHQGGPLSDGIVDQEKVICPLHGFAFSLETGEGFGQSLSVRRYEVRSSGGRILAKFPVSRKRAVL
ncbi:MAG: Rieske 2Fe-2S domain-containing protein, partial [Candidatus Methylacidiphilaceae bacterium]